jgi:hypothetical protein
MTGENEPVYATAAAVAGLAREVEALRRAIDGMRQITGRVEELASLVARLAETSAAAAVRPERGGTPSWLDLPNNLDAADLTLNELLGWMAKVYLRYADAARSLPDCWLWHPDVVEELLWLMHAWGAAYRFEGVSVSLAADWHDRLRPGVVRRIKAGAGQCSLENHQPGRELHTPALRPPLAGATEAIAGWWAAHRAGEPPGPTDQHVAAAAAHRALRGRK